MEHVSYHDKILAHLYNYRHLRYDIDYDAPAQITQDGIAESVGITRSHVSIILRRMIESNEVVFSFASVKRSSRPQKRKVYHITDAGKKILADRIRSLKEDDVELMDLCSIMGADDFDALKSKFGDRLECIGCLSVIRTRITTSDVGFASPVIVVRPNGEVAVQTAFKTRLLRICPEKKIMEWHSMAADWCLDRDCPVSERVYHLGMAGRDREALRLLSENGHDIMDNADRDLSIVVSKVVMRNGRSDLLPMAARMALDTGELETASEMIPKITESDPCLGHSLVCEVLLRSDRTEEALSLAKARGSADIDSGLILGLCLYANDRYAEALDTFEATKGMMLEQGCIFRMDELLRWEAVIEMEMGDSECAKELLDSALKLSRNRDRKLVL